MRIIVSRQANASIKKYYNVIAEKYRYSYSLQNMKNNINEVRNALKTLKDDGKTPTLQKFKALGYKEISYRQNKKSQWFFEYTLVKIKGEICMYVHEAVHNTQMHDSYNSTYIGGKQLYEQIMKDIALIVKRAINEMS